MPLSANLFRLESYRPKQRSCRKTKLKKIFFFRGDFIREPSDGPQVATICIFCSLEPMTAKHIFVECRSLRQRRARFLFCCNNSNSISLVDILGPSLIVSETLNFLSDISLLNYVKRPPYRTNLTH